MIQSASTRVTELSVTYEDVYYVVIFAQFVCKLTSDWSSPFPGTDPVFAREVGRDVDS